MATSQPLGVTDEYLSGMSQTRDLRPAQRVGRKGARSYDGGERRSRRGGGRWKGRRYIHTTRRDRARRVEKTASGVHGNLVGHDGARRGSGQGHGAVRCHEDNGHTTFQSHTGRGLRLERGRASHHETDDEADDREALGRNGLTRSFLHGRRHRRLKELGGSVV